MKRGWKRCGFILLHGFLTLVLVLPVGGDPTAHASPATAGSRVGGLPAGVLNQAEQTLQAFREALAAVWEAGQDGARRLRQALHDQLTATSVTVDPQLGGRLASPDGQIVLDVPAGALSEPVRFSYYEIGRPIQAGSPVVLAFELRATRLRDGQAIERFDRPLTLTARYDPAQLGRFHPSTLHFRFVQPQTGWPQIVPSIVDEVQQTVSAQIDHFSTWYFTADQHRVDIMPLADVEKFRAEHFTGAAVFDFPLVVPPGPGGLAPLLRLTYNSQSSYLAQRAGYMSVLTYDEGYQSAGPYGEGFAIPLGQIDLQKTRDATIWHLSLPNGIGGRLVKVNDNEYRLEDDRYVQIRRDVNGIPWEVTTPDGTRYRFGTDPEQQGRRLNVKWENGVDFHEVNRWMISEIIDRHGNSISYSYWRPAKQLRHVNQYGVCLDALAKDYTPTVYPSEIRYGVGVGAVKIVFNRTDPNKPRLDVSDLWRGIVNGREEPVCRQHFYYLYAIDSIDIYIDANNFQGGSLVRRYKFVYHGSGLYDDTRLGGIPLRLKELQLWDKTGESFAIKRTLLTFEDTLYIEDQICNDHITDGSIYNKCDEASENWGKRNLWQVTKITNLHGGWVSFTYDKAYAEEPGHRWIDQWGREEHTASGYRVLYRRVTSRTVADGIGAGPERLEQYSYGQGRGNENAEQPEFRGHEWATITTGSRAIEHHFLQGRGMTRTLKDGSQMTDQRPAQGRIWRTVVKERQGDITYVFRIEENRYDANLQTVPPDYTGTDAKFVRLLDRWRYDFPINATSEDDPRRKGVRTTYHYDPYGNVGRIDEYQEDNRSLYRYRDRVFRPQTERLWLVDRLGIEIVYTGAGAWQGETWYGYDGNVTEEAGPSGYTPSGCPNPIYGDLTLVRRVLERFEDSSGVVGAATADTSYSYDCFGNRTSETTYATAGFVARSRTSPSAETGTVAGFGSDPFTSRATFDSTHTYPETVSYPVASHGNETFTYNYALGKVSARTDPNGAVTTYEYEDVTGRLLRVYRPGESQASGHEPTIDYRYDDAARPARLTTRRRTDLGGANPAVYHETVRYFDGLGRLIQEKVQAEDGQWVERNWSYDRLGRKLRESIPRFSTTSAYSSPGDWSGLKYTSYSYDALDRVTTVATPYTPSQVALTITTYDLWTTRVVDPNGHCTEYERDAFGRLSKVREYRGISPNCGAYTETTYRYDLFDRLTGVTAGDGGPLQIQLWYDPLGRKTQLADPDLGVWTYRYDVRGNLRQQTDARQVGLLFTYDAENRLTGRGTQIERISAGEIEALRVAVDRLRAAFGLGGYGWADRPLGPGSHIRALHLTQLRDALRGLPGRASIQFSDGDPASGRRITRRDIADVRRWVYGDETYGEPHTALASYGYDDTTGGNAGRGRRTSARAGAWSGSYRYDGRGRLSAETQTIDGASYPTSYSYDALDRVRTQSYPDGEQLTFGYNPRTLLQSVSGYVSSLSYTALDQPLLLRNAAGGEWRFGYDPSHQRLTSLQLAQPYLPTQTFSYSYDLVGNLASRTENNVATSFGYDDRDRLTQASGGFAAAYSYDPLGNLLAKSEGGQTRTLSYDLASRPKHAPKSVDGVAYHYDANGNLVSDGTRTLVYDAENRLVQVSLGGVTVQYGYDADGQRVKRTVGDQTTHHVGKHYERNLTTGQVTKYYAALGRLVALRTSAGVQWLFGDHLGSTVGATSGATTGPTTRYWPFGELREPQGELPTDRRFTGQRLEASTGLSDYQARFYSPQLGRFLQPDTLVPEPSNPQGLNRYAYALNNPLRYTDPSGHVVVQPDCFSGACFSDETDDTDDLEEIPPGEYGCAPSLPCNAEVVFSEEFLWSAGASPPQAATGTLLGATVWRPGPWLATAERATPDDDQSAGAGSGGGTAPSGNGSDVAQQAADSVAGARTSPPLKPGAAGGPSAGRDFPQAVRDQAFAENPGRTCVFCRMDGTATQVDHAIPRRHGGNATLDNAQLACPHCNSSKGARKYPSTPPPGYRGPWPPPWWQ